MITYGAISKIGDRGNNEDCVNICAGSAGYLFALADGLGGHGLGDVASKIAVEQAIAAFQDSGGDLARCFSQAQEQILAEQKRRQVKNEIKTTLVCLRIVGNAARWGHVGDSRLYYFSKNKLIRRSFDHSVSQALAAAGEIKEKDIRRHEDRNRLLRVIGIEWDSPKYELSEEVDLNKGDAFLLCSDGFWEWIEDKAMLKTMKNAGTPKQWLGLMEEEVLRNGRGNNMDNYSAIAVFVS
ncbi:MAG: serine/threonine-protein phosphatase [Gracilibacteraceae bacterium]|jgi:serine/threonine protein phosphatase PrpC|nr:serine/threonine-protein phosphatase [Gracilibacteraceae bacterium]